MFPLERTSRSAPISLQEGAESATPPSAPCATRRAQSDTAPRAHRGRRVTAHRGRRGEATPSPQRSAWDYALGLVAAREYTAHGLRRKLLQKEYPPEEIDSTLERLLSSKLVDDARYAAEFVRQKLVLRGAAARRVRQELLRKGIDAPTVDESIAHVMSYEDVDQEAAIERMAVKKAASLGDIDERVKRQRLFSFLARKGYEVDDIKRVIGRVMR